MEMGVRELFERYEHVFRCALRGDANMDEAALLYATEFIAATPAGVVTGKNDEKLKQVMADGYARYRAQGMKDIQLQGLGTSAIDEGHCVVHAAWMATYECKGQPDIAIHLSSEPKVFGWVSGDEQALLKQHGPM